MLVSSYLAVSLFWGGTCPRLTPNRQLQVINIINYHHFLSDLCRTLFWNKALEGVSDIACPSWMYGAPSVTRVHYIMRTSGCVMDTGIRAHLNVIHHNTTAQHICLAPPMESSCYHHHASLYHTASTKLYYTTPTKLYYTVLTKLYHATPTKLSYSSHQTTIQFLPNYHTVPPSCTIHFLPNYHTVSIKLPFSSYQTVQ